VSPEIALIFALAAQLAEAERALCVQVGGEPHEDPRYPPPADDPARVDLPQATIH